MLESARKNHVAVNPSQSRSQLRERHANLKSDARFFRQHDHGSATPNRFKRGVKNRADFRWLAVKMSLQIVPAAEVRLVAVGEMAFAGRALPKRAGGTGRCG